MYIYIYKHITIKYNVISNQSTLNLKHTILYKNVHVLSYSIMLDNMTSYCIILYHHESSASIIIYQKTKYIVSCFITITITSFHYITLYSCYMPIKSCHIKMSNILTNRHKWLYSYVLHKVLRRFFSKNHLEFLGSQDAGTSGIHAGLFGVRVSLHVPTAMGTPQNLRS